MSSADLSLEQVARTNELIAYHGAISAQMTAERTSLESGLIPVTAYILVSAAEAWYRWPKIAATIDQALSAEQIGASGRRPGSRVNAVHLWSAANIYLLGRKMLTAFGVADEDPPSTYRVLDFCDRAARSFRDDGHRQAWDAGFTIPSYEVGVVAELANGATRVESDADRFRITRFNATLQSYLFLLYFDTRVGTGDSGPYALPDGRTLVVRDFYELGPSRFWWSDVAREVPYRNLTAGLILEGVDVKVNDWGTSITNPERYLPHLVGYSLFTTDTHDGSMRAVPLDELDAIAAEVRTAQAAHYRNVAAMSRAEKVRCGAYVYFTFLRPFAEVAGVADDIDWTVPRDTAGSLYEMLEPIEGTDTSDDDGLPYYWPLGWRPSG
ncbi:MAG TPA: hypothetical protein VNB24_02190 [Acidimicrobiales bacterium]|nr:hypothetical protein [Acidimicrobiales bacterium]